MRLPSVTAAVIALALWACPSPSTRVGSNPRPAGANDVVISDYKFVPKTLTVSVGTTVTWINHDMARHTVTRRMTDEPFDSGVLENQDIFTHQFKTAGTYDYMCVPHAGMQGTIIVK